LLISLLIGCGGSGASNGKIRAKVTIEWPDISRGVEAPPYAGSAQISLLIGSSQIASRWFVDRPTNSSAQSISYDSPDLTAIGPALLQVTFYEKPGANGSQVAIASASVKISSDGTLLNSAGGALGTVSYGSTLSAIDLNIQDISVGESKELAVTSPGWNGIIAIPLSRITMSLADNTHAELANNTLTGISEGFAKVSVTFESRTQDFDIWVVPTIANFRTEDFPATNIAYDSLRGKIWGTFGPNTTYPNSIVEIDPFSGVVGNPISVGSNPNHLAVSADGSKAYVGIDGANGLRIVDLGSRVPGALIELMANSNPATVQDIDVNPLNPNEVAVCLQVSFSGNGWGPVVFRDGVEIGLNSGQYGPQRATYTSGSSLFGADFQNGYQYSIGLNSVDQVQLMPIQPGNFQSYQVMPLAGTKAVMPSGQVFDTNTFSQLGVVSYGNDQLLTTGTDRTNDIAWSVFAGSAINHSSKYFLRAFDLETFAPIGSISLPFNESVSFPIMMKAKRFGNSGIAILFNGKLFLVQNTPGL
jgi:hypothetical protein